MVDMFSERVPKTEPADEQTVVKKERSPFMTRLMDFGKWFLEPPPDPPAAGSADWYWYGGLCADPHTFTEQLCKLQKSLAPADTPTAKQEAAEGVPVEVRSDPQA
jgi:hypothetical protein